MTTEAKAAAEAIDKMELAQCASCTCLTKTPVIDYHAPECRYRVLVEGVNALRDLQSQLRAAQQECERLNTVIKHKNAAIDRFRPCPDCRDKVKAGDCQRCARQRAEAECERLTGEALEADRRASESEQRYLDTADECERLRERLEQTESIVPHFIGGVFDWAMGEYSKAHQGQDTPDYVTLFAWCLWKWRDAEAKLLELRDANKAKDERSERERTEGGV